MCLKWKMFDVFKNIGVDEETKNWCFFGLVKGKGRVMCKACEVGKIVVNKCLNKDIYINTQKLQKLLTLMQIECIKQTNKPLFKEDIRIWTCGVAIKEVDEEFGGSAVYFAKEAGAQLTEFLVLLEIEEKVVDTIIEKYGEFEASDINELPIIEDLIKKFKKDCDRGTPHIIVDDLIKEFGKGED